MGIPSPAAAGSGLALPMRTARMAVLRPIQWRGGIHAGGLLLALLLAGQMALYAQSNTRLVLSSGTGVPGHAGFAFGPFSGLAMNEEREIVFLSTLHSARSEIRAVIRSSGISYSVVAFQGLRSPVPKTSFDSFSAPSINKAASIAFTAGLKDSEEAPASAVVRADGANFRAVATAGDPVPGNGDAKFVEFSAPLIDEKGNILFAGRWEGKKPGVGLFLWTSAGLQSLTLPAGLTLLPKGLLEPIFFSHDEAVFVSRDLPASAALEQFFRAVATRSFQELKPPPEPTATVEVLPARPGGPAVQMVLVLLENGSAQTALLPGDPTQAVMAKRPPPNVPTPQLTRIEGETTGAQGNIIFAAATLEPANDLGLYCYCDGQAVRLTSPEEFLPITQAGPGMPILSLTSDSLQTVAFIGPGPGGEASAIYVTSLP